MKTRFNKIISTILVAVMLVTAAPLSGFVGLDLNFDWINLTTRASAATGTCGTNAIWTFEESTGELVISGKGAMTDCRDIYDIPWYYFCSSIKKVTIPDGITHIGNFAFYGCNSLVNLTIPDSVTSIGNSAFSGCSGLTSITIPDSVTSIGNSAFSSCSGLTSLVIPDGVTYISDDLFRCCSSLTSVTIPDSVTTIGISAFYRCTSLTSVTIPDSVTTIGNYTFSECTSLTSIIIPDNVTAIGYYVFESCTSLISITVAADNQYYSSDSYGVLYNKNKTVLVQYPIGNERTTFSISDTVATISSGAFTCCQKLTSVTIGNNVTRIESSAFYDCSGLTSVAIGKSVTRIGDSAFANCIKLGNITLPISVQTIGNRAFAGCQNITLKIYNRNCTFGTNATSYNTTIVGYVSSTAEVYANENGFDFELIPDDDHEHIYSNTCDAECNICGYTRTDLVHTYSSVCDVDCDLCNYIRTDAVHTYSNGCDPECDVCSYIRTELTHTFDNDCDTECNVCGDVRTPKHTDENNDGICDVCEKALSDILVGVEQNFKVKVGETVYIKFIPANSGVYTYYSSSSADTYGYVCDGDKNVLASNDDYNGTNFSITYTFKAGTVYYLGVRYYSSSNSGEIPVTIRLDELICDHNNTHSEHKDSTCSEYGYDKVICSSCGATISETELPLLEHSYKAIVANPTCQSAGMVAYYCTSCKYAYVSEITDPVDHLMSWEVVSKPTSTADGEMHYTCSYCGLVEDTKVVPAFLISDNSVANIDFDSNTISGFDAGSTSLDGYVSVENGEYTFVCDSAVIGTGTVIELTDGDVVVEEFTAVIFGDVNGDGWYDGTDSIIVSCLANGLLTQDSVSEAVYRAADCNHDGVIDSFDVALLEQAGLLLSGVDQSKSNEELATDEAFIEYLDLIDQTPEDEDVEDEIIETPEVEAEDEFDFIEFIITIIKKFFKLLLSTLPIK